jgi:uncharacterized protein (TIGR00299 family) protein
MHQQHQNSQAPSPRIAYLDCFAGISGDMFLAALLDAGLDPAILHQAAAALALGVTLKVETVDRSGIASTKVHVLVANAPADEPHQHPHTAPQTDARSLSTIRTLIQSSTLSTAVQHTAIHTFELLGAAEARIHNVDIEAIHFHEVGAVDAIVDIVAAAAGIHALNDRALAETGQPIRWHCSAINVGGGMVQCAHGLLPVPAPATADLLRGLPTYSAHLQKELVTPTGAAILRTLAPSFGPQPPMRVTAIGYGAGTRNPKEVPNVIRLSLGDAIANTQQMDALFPEDKDTITILETALDDLSPQIIAYVAEQALTIGALDVMLIPVQMKKGRPGTLMTILSDHAHAPALQHLLLTETSTLGIRIRHERRITLDRTHTTVTTPYGPIRIKLGAHDGNILNAAPEFEDCRTAATNFNVPVKQVFQAAIAAYLTSAAQ